MANNYNEVGQFDPLPRPTGNFLDKRHGRTVHNEHITFHEYLQLPEAQWLFEDDFMQLPGYIDVDPNYREVCEMARISVRDWIFNEFDRLFLGQQDYVRWGQRFKNRIEALKMAFWGQVRLQGLYDFKELEYDDGETHSHGTGLRIGTNLDNGGITTTTDGTNSNEGHSRSEGHTTALVPSVSKTAISTMPKASNVLGPITVQGPDTDWSYMDSLQQNWASPGDQLQTNDTDREGSGINHQVSTTQRNGNGSSELTDTSDNTTNSKLTNKQFVLELERMYRFMAECSPLLWLGQQLRPMFDLLW